MDTGNLSLPKGYSLIAFEEIESTNIKACEDAGNGAPHGTVVWALAQKGGYGRKGSNWVSPKGNLYLSLILKPNVKLQEVVQLGFVSSLAIKNTLEELAPHCQVTLKWPNDVLLNGKKVAGLLIETSVLTNHKESVDWVVLGVGINLVSFPKNTRYPATSLAHESTLTKKVEPLYGLELFLNNFEKLYKTWTQQGFVGIRKRWLDSHNLEKGDSVEARLVKSTVYGRFVDITQDGFLLIESDNKGIVEIHTGDVFPLHSNKTTGQKLA